MPCPCKPTRVSFVTGRRVDRADVCLRHDEVMPGHMDVCPRCQGSGRRCLASEEVDAIWTTCPMCEGRKVVYLLDEMASA